LEKARDDLVSLAEQKKLSECRKNLLHNLSEYVLELRSASDKN